MSKKKKTGRIQVILRNPENNKYSYNTVMKKVAGVKLSLNKYCPILRKHVKFVQVK
jgi:ribosomal protein L33